MVGHSCELRLHRRESPGQMGRCCHAKANGGECAMKQARLRGKT